jgi:hypothetical protein
MLWMNQRSMRTTLCPDAGLRSTKNEAAHDHMRRLQYR